MFRWSMILLLMVLLMCVLFNSERSDAAKLGDAIVFASDVRRSDIVHFPEELDSDEMPSIDTLAISNQRLQRNSDERENRIDANKKQNGDGAVGGRNVVQNSSSTSNDGQKTTQPFSKSIMGDTDQNALPKVIEQTFNRNCTGEYSYNLRFSDGTRRAETAEFEERDGKQIFIVRGLYTYVNDKGQYQAHLYVFDNKGYHEISLNATTTDGEVNYFGTDTEGGPACDKGSYCIDTKLLHILVG